MNKEEMILWSIVATGLAVPIYNLPAGNSKPSPSSRAITFDLLAKTKKDARENLIFPDELKVCDGKHVVISGFSAPLNDPQDFSKLLLMPTPGGCYFCSPVGAARVILVRSKEQKRIWYDGGLIAFEGVLHLAGQNSSDQESNGFYFIMDDARLVSTPP